MEDRLLFVGEQLIVFSISYASDKWLIFLNFPEELGLNFLPDINLNSFWN